MIDVLFQYIGPLFVSSGGALGIIAWLGPKVASKLIDVKVAERLESYKHEQQKELENLRFQLKSLSDRLSKYNEKEYEVLPEALVKLKNAYWKAGALLSPVQSYRDLNRMYDLELEEFIKDSGLDEWEKKTLRETDEKQRFYQERISWHQLSEALAASKECHIYLEKNGIFLEPKIQDQFNHIDTLIWKAVRAEELNRTHNFKEHARLPEEIDSLMKDLEKKVQARLRG